MMSLDKIQTTHKTGQEQLHYNEKSLPFSLLDFWRWSVSDILSNATRGIFAEFIVASAINIDLTKIRDEWGNYDIESLDGIKIEVKSAAYLQTWHQESLSKISFSIKTSYAWDYNTNKREDIKKRQADVYVFCLLHHEDKLTVDPLNMNQWEFYVVATKQLDGYIRSQHSINLKSLKSLAKAICYNQLNEEIILVNKIHN